MHSAPEPIADPYRTLGLAPGASMAEVKRAYRLLAKAFHPDSAGEAALPRFLAIHEAYEHIRTGRVVIAGRVARPSPAAPAEPWRADPDRARAARERARTARNGSGGATGSKGRPGTRNDASAGAGAPGSAGAAGASGSPGSAPPGGARGSTGTRGSGGRRNTRKATMGSTSYDEARDPNDASWSGASWYGPTTGEYWIINPREYADPRKHGPEYQSRARRPPAGELPDDSPAAEETVAAASSTGDAPAEEAAAWSSEGAATDRPGPTIRRAGRGRTAAAPKGPATADSAATSGGSAAASPDAGAQSRRWTPPASDPRWDPPDGGRGAAPGRNGGRPGETAPDDLRVDAFGAAPRAWLGRSTDDPVRRLGLALVAWPPIGLAAAALIGDVTGCSVYSAGCGGVEPLLPWLAQAAILGLLLLLPPLTRVLAGGAVMVLLALLPITAFLIAVGGTGAPQAGFALATLLGIAWLVGVGWSSMAFRRQRARASP